jgi:hypothetical protein
VARLFSMSLVLFAGLLPASCNILKESVNDTLLTCGDACVKIQECDVAPPSPEFGSLGAVSSGEGGLDCAASCSADDRELRGYSDCQLDCINDVGCDKIEECWKPKSETYAKFCLEGREVPDVAPSEGEPAPSNGTTTGNEDVDEIIEDPSVAIAVDEAEEEGFELNYGDNPPRLVGKYRVSGEIDESRNARPEGSPIQTAICFWDYDAQEGGVYISYCEDNVPGEDRAPLTGSEDGSFTAYFEYPGQATILFSGKLNDDGTTADNVEALVVYTYATDVWELSHTDWELVGECDSCN